MDSATTFVPEEDIIIDMDVTSTLVNPYSSLLDALQLRMLDPVTLELILPEELSELSNLEIVLYDITGAKIKTWSFTHLHSNQLRLQTPELKRGIYFLKLSGKGIAFTKKFRMN
jgi:hypothetical protein